MAMLGNHDYENSTKIDQLLGTQQGDSANQQQAADLDSLQSKADVDVQEAQQLQNDISQQATQNALLLGHNPNDANQLGIALGNRVDKDVQLGVQEMHAQAAQVAPPPNPAVYLSQANLDACTNLSDVAKLYQRQHAAAQNNNAVSLADHLPKHVQDRVHQLAMTEAKQSGADMSIVIESANALLKRLEQSGNGSLNTIADSIKHFDDSIYTMKKISIAYVPKPDSDNKSKHISTADAFAPEEAADYKVNLYTNVLKVHPKKYLIANSSDFETDVYAPTSEPKVGNPKNWGPIVRKFAETTRAKYLLGQSILANKKNYQVTTDLNTATDELKRHFNPSKKVQKTHAALKAKSDKIKVSHQKELEKSDDYKTQVETVQRFAQQKLATITNNYARNPTGKELIDLLNSLTSFYIDD